MSFSDMEKLAYHVAQSNLFGIKTIEQAMTLMAIAQAEGRHPALAARDYDIIQNRPAKKSEALLRDFLMAGGKVEWHELTDAVADATFSHPQGGSVRIKWDMDRAKQAGLAGKDNWKKWPRQMLRSRCVSEGARSVCPVATGDMLSSDELRDELPEKDITAESTVIREDAVTLKKVLYAYDACADVPAFQRARELAATLPEDDKVKAREKDAATKARLQKPKKIDYDAAPERLERDLKASIKTVENLENDIPFEVGIMDVRRLIATDDLDAAADLARNITDAVIRKAAEEEVMAANKHKAQMV